MVANSTATTWRRASAPGSSSSSVPVYWNQIGVRRVRPTRHADRPGRPAVRADHAHDLEGLVACFGPDYALSNPVHPARDFVGPDQVQRNWTGLFAGVPDLTASLHALVADGEQVWVELSMNGTRRDGMLLHLAGVQVFMVREGLIRGCRFYLEPVDPGGVDADGAARQAVGPP